MMLPTTTMRVLAAAAALLTLAARPAMAQRAMGIDVSAYQGAINWATVAKPQSQGGGGVQFAFVRASRGGTIGTYNQNTGVGTASNRYDDPFTAQNMARAKANGVLAGVYHYARIDLINNTDPNFPNYAGNTGLDEANHFLATAGQYMTPGHIRPVVDVEAGDVQTSPAQLTAWVMQFSDRILAATGVRPIVYINANYATNEVTSPINVHDLWLARYLYTPSDAATSTERAAFAAQAQTIAPPTPSGYASPYGVFKTTANPVPWDFWQYSSDGRTPGITGAVDQDVANADVEAVKEFLVPAIWMSNADGAWTNGANWNAAGALPTANDRTIIDRPASNYLVTLSTGAQSVRSLQLNERLTINGGSLTAAQFVNVANTLTVSGGSLSADTISNTTQLVLNSGAIQANSIVGTGTTTVSGGTLKATSIRQNALTISGGVAKLDGASAVSVVKSLAVSGAGTLDVADGASIVDYTLASPVAASRTALRSAWNGGTWTGPGITSSTLAPGEGVALLASSQLFANFTAAAIRGEPVDASAVLLVRAKSGDTDFSGSVDFADLLALAKQFNAAGDWHGGDSNYDGVVNFDDLLALAKNFGQATTSPLMLAAATSPSFASDWSLAQSLVPEPAPVLSVIAVVACARRRRLG